MTPGMIRVRRRMIEIGEIWFDEQPTQPLPDVLVLRQRYAPPGGDDYTTQRSLVNDLTVSEETLWSGLGNTCRYKVRRAKERDGVVCASFDQPTDQQIREFADFYAAFAKQKDLQPEKIDKLIATARVNRLHLSMASSNGEAIVWHSYVVTRSVARLANTASLFRSDDPERRAVIGRANRMLHWNDMMEFKKAGLEKYDWGGVFIDETIPEQKNINSFKREFGGVERGFFGGIQGISLQGKLYLAARRLLRRDN